MKWAYPEYIELCLPEAAAQGRRTKSFAIFDKAKPTVRWGRKATGLKRYSGTCFLGFWCFFKIWVSKAAELLSVTSLMSLKVMFGFFVIA